MVKSRWAQNQPPVHHTPSDNSPGKGGFCPPLQGQSLSIFSPNPSSPPQTHLLYMFNYFIAFLYSLWFMPSFLSCKKDSLVDNISHSLKKVLSQTALRSEEVTLLLSGEPMAHSRHANFKYRLLLLLSL